MDDYSEIAFECILQPSVLDTKVFGLSTKSEFEDRKTSVGILLELLTQLCSVTKTQIAVNIEGMFVNYVFLHLFSAETIVLPQYFNFLLDI